MTSHCLLHQGASHSRTALFSHRKMLILYSISVCNNKCVCGVKSKQITYVSMGHPKLNIFFSHLCSNNTQNKDFPRIIIFFLLPFREISRTPLWRKLLRTIEIPLLLKVLMCVVWCASGSSRLQTALSLISGFSFVNEKFRGNCIILNSDCHKEMHLTSQCSSFDYFTGNMLEAGETSPEEKVMKDQKRDIFIFEIKGLFSKILLL